MRTTTSSKARSLLGAIAIATAMSVSLLQPIAFAEPSASDLATARDLFTAGMKLRASGDAKGALEKLKAAHALAATPITAVELGRTYESLTMLTEAWDVYLEVPRLPVDPQESPKAKKARADAAKLATDVVKRIPSIRVKIDGAPEGTKPTVTVDGATVPFEALVEPRKVNPGSHTIVAKVGDGAETKVDVEVAEGETKDVTLKVVPPTPPVVVVPEPVVKPVPTPIPYNPPTHETVTTTKTNPLVYVGIAVGGAGLLVGGAFGLLSISKTSTVRAECLTSKECPASAKGDVDAAKTLGNVSTFGFIGMGVGATLTVIGLLVGGETVQKPVDSAYVQPWVGLGSAGISGAF